MTRTVNEWITLVHDVAVDKGWWTPMDLSGTSIQAKLMLVVTEVAEAVELANAADELGPLPEEAPLTFTRDLDSIYL